MRDDAGRGASDSRDSRGTDQGDEESDIPPWDETMHGGSRDDGVDAEETSSGNVAGEFRPSENIEPGDPSLENSLFVIFGAYIAVLGLTRLFLDVQGFDARDIVVLTGGTLLLSIVLLGFLGLLTPDT